MMIVHTEGNDLSLSAGLNATPFRSHVDENVIHLASDQFPDKPPELTHEE